MKEFARSPQCDACGSKYIKIRFMEYVGWDHTRLQCICNNCGYIWFMKTLRGKEEEKDE